jgi:two-component system NtrC family response regulator
MSVAVGETLGSVVAVSAALRELLKIASRLADAKSPVLLEGESGTGKDLLAHWIHYKGSRRDGPFIKIHCPAIPEDLLESELFGHEKGAFTDARHTKAGKIELAAGGTLYFDQIQDLSPSLQAKLLRVVEERRFERLGGTRTLEVDVRFISSSTANLRQAAAEGTFRDDLYHRLGVVPLCLPPLREHPEDILPLAEVFLARERERKTTSAVAFLPETVELMRGYAWPGNARELKGAVERAALYTPGEGVPPSALPQHIREQPRSLWAGRERRPTLREVELAYIRYVLEQSEGNQTRAASVLGISRKALWEKRRRFGIP